MGAGRRSASAVGAIVLLTTMMQAGPSTARAEPEYAAVDPLKLNQVRIEGSHNSYRPYPSSAEEQRIRTWSPAAWPSLAYGHPPLESQLALGLRQIEIDVAPDPQGGAYAAPYANGTAETRAVMAAPGAKVLHMPGLDTETHCLSFRLCLAILARWSTAHPDHAPLVVLVNSVDPELIPGYWDRHLAFDQAGIDDLERDLAQQIGRSAVLAPDEVRGSHATLREAVTAGGWPTMSSLRGRFLFVLDGSDAHEAFLRAGHRSLIGRLMFGWFPEDAPEAAVFNIQDPLADQDRIRRLAAQGFIVRTRADEGGVEARRKDGRRMAAALASGAQIISTDYYAGVPDPNGLGYVAAFGGAPVRCDDARLSCPKPAP